MQKRNLMLILFLGLFLINLISAYGYSDLTLSNILDNIDESTLILGSVFIVSFALMNIALTRVFSDSKATGTVIAGVISLFITYWVNRSGYDISSLFYGFGVPIDIFYLLLPFAFLAGIIFIIFRLKRNSLIVIGALLILLGFIAAEGTIFIILGIITFIVGLFVIKKKDKETFEWEKIGNNWFPKTKKKK